MTTSVADILNEHSSMIEELKNLGRNCCDNCYAFDYFLEVKRNVLLEREKIKLAVDDHYLAIYDAWRLTQRLSENLLITQFRYMKAKSLK